MRSLMRAHLLAVHLTLLFECFGRDLEAGGRALATVTHAISARSTSTEARYVG